MLFKIMIGEEGHIGFGYLILKEDGVIVGGDGKRKILTFGIFTGHHIAGLESIIVNHSIFSVGEVADGKHVKISGEDGGGNIKIFGREGFLIKVGDFILHLVWFAKLAIDDDQYEVRFGSGKSVDGVVDGLSFFRGGFIFRGINRLGRGQQIYQMKGMISLGG